MRRIAPLSFLSLAALGVVACHRSSSSSTNTIEATGDTATVSTHFSQQKIELGQTTIDDCIAQGRLLFAANFNELDGEGRPETTGTGAVRNRRVEPQNFNRISSPEANSCGGCHNVPRLGGGGDNVANVFVLGQRFEFVNFDGGVGDGGAAHTLQNVANERNTLGMFGSGFIELLSREITADLQSTQADAIVQAAAAAADVTLSLDSKGINYGSITAHSNGTVDTSAVVGVDADLVIRPFHQKGVVVSLREFTNNAMNHHHGMQTEERFGTNVDADKDGMVNELSKGDMTALVLFQATLPAPGRVFPGTTGTEAAAVSAGETLFSTLGCAVCHVPELTLNDPVFSEPNPYNPAGNLRPADVASLVDVDLTTAGPGPHLAKESDGTVKIHAYTDLKRHDMGAGLAEPLVQAGVPGNLFITRKLWGTYNEPPYMHHGRATTLKEAILMHGGEAQTAHDNYAALSNSDQDKVIAFLKTLQVLPEDATSNEIVGTPTGFVGDVPQLGGGHIAQGDVDNGVYSSEALFSIGKNIFNANFNTLDGQGRPTTTGTGVPRGAHVAPENFNRISAPDSNSCAGCHNTPRSGGGGDNVTNVFVLGQRFSFVRFDGVSADDAPAGTHLDNVADERNTLGMFGSGFIELLAREMTVDLQAIRTSASTQAVAAGHDVTLSLDTKGVNFGSITAHSDGTFDTSAIVGINTDLLLRPFHQKGVVVSIREFTNNAENHHHGMQSSERFGDGLDPDGDGMADELSRGDVTATVIYQAMLPVSGRKLPSNARKLASVNRGETLFGQVGCTSCHIPTLTLNNPVFSEPNPFNPNTAGPPPNKNMQVSDVPHTFDVDLTAHGIGPRLPKEANGTVLVPAFTDLKRHDMGAGLNNEKVVQGGVPTSQFLTKKLWGFYSEPPFMHDSRSLTVQDAILRHGGEAATAQAAFVALSARDQKCIVDFLKTMQTLPEGSPLVVTSDD
jgi:CxxC motif-containing protein (DUF1111 family)